MKRVVYVLVLFCIAFFLKGCTITGQEVTKLPSADELEATSYVHAADGDTIIVHDSCGEELRVRLIGIDTEESVHEDEQQNNEFGLQASEYTKALLEDADTLYLEYDAEQYDQYDRVLAYVWLEPTPDELSDMLNATLVQDGYARAVLYEPNHKYAIELENLQSQAQEDRSGLWQYDGFWILTEDYDNKKVKMFSRFLRLQLPTAWKVLD